MKQFFKGAAAGVAGTLLLVGSLGYAQSLTQSIQVEFLPLRYIFDGQQKAPPSDQQGFIYKDRTYVPLRFVAESLGKEVTWDGTNYVITIADGTRSSGAPAAGTTPSTFTMGNSQPTQLKKPVYVDGSITDLEVPLLVVHGEVLASAALAGRLAGVPDAQWDTQSQTVTYRSADITLALSPSGATINGHPSSPSGVVVNASRLYVPLRLLVETFGGTYEQKEDGIYIAHLKTPPQRVELKHILFEFKDGTRFRWGYPTNRDNWFDGRNVYLNLNMISTLLAVLDGNYRTNPTDLPGGLSGLIDGDGAYYSEDIKAERRFADPSDINSRSHYVFTVINPTNGKSLEVSTEGTPFENRDFLSALAVPSPYSLAQVIDKLGLTVRYSYDSKDGVLILKLAN